MPTTTQDPNDSGELDLGGKRRLTDADGPAGVGRQDHVNRGMVGFMDSVMLSLRTLNSRMARAEDGQQRLSDQVNGVKTDLKDIKDTVEELTEHDNINKKRLNDGDGVLRDMKKDLGEIKEDLNDRRAAKAASSAFWKNMKEKALERILFAIGAIFLLVLGYGVIEYLNKEHGINLKPKPVPARETPDDGVRNEK